mgnify:FL=1
MGIKILFRVVSEISSIIDANYAEMYDALIFVKTVSLADFNLNKLMDWNSTIQKPICSFPIFHKKIASFFALNQILKSMD